MKSSIFQMQWNSEFKILVVSTHFVSVICNTISKTFWEIGHSKSGKFGACVIKTSILEANQGNKLRKTDLSGNFIKTLHLFQEFKNVNGMLF